MSFYDDMAQTAAELISEFGSTFTFRRTTAGTLDAATQVMSGQIETDYTPKGIWTKFEKDYAGQVEVGDKLLLIDKSHAPELGEVIIDGSKKWRIVELLPLQPADTLLITRCHVRT